MIVKNESRIITRMFDSVLPIIDTFCICDTGSTDDTIAIITSYFASKNITGIIHTEPFINFGHNRNIALTHARTHIKCDYILLLDADMKLVISPAFNRNILAEADGFQIMQKNPHVEYYNLRIIHSRIETVCVGVTHEYYDTPNAKHAKLPANLIMINDIGDGGAKSDKYSRDIRLLEAGLANTATNAGMRQRYLFYLANSYMDCGMNEKARDTYIARIAAGGWHEEIFYSHLRLGQLYMRLGDVANAIVTWLHGYGGYPRRAETLFEIVKHYRVNAKPLLAWHFYCIARHIPYPTSDVLFINYPIYDYMLEYEASILIYYIPLALREGCIGYDIIYKLMQNASAEGLYGNMLSNYKFYVPAMGTICNGVRIHNFNEHIKVEFGGHMIELHSSTPCLFRHNGDWYMNVRYVNYTINKANGSYNGTAEHITTFNKMMKLSHDTENGKWEIMESKLIPQPYCSGMRYQGLEDCKINVCGGRAVYVGTMWNVATAKLTIGYGTNYMDDITSGLQYKPCCTKYNAECEKNWVFAGDMIIYKWYPLTLGKLVNGDGGDNMMMLRIDKTVTTPWIFKHVRGSSNAFWWDNSWWAVTHIVYSGAPRIYYFMLVMLSAEFEILKYSKLFKFSVTDKIEFCLGLVIDDGWMHMSYSAWDGSTNICSVMMTEIMKLFG